MRPEQRGGGEDVSRPVAHARLAEHSQLRQQGEHARRGSRTRTSAPPASTRRAAARPRRTRPRSGLCGGRTAPVPARRAQGSRASRRSATGSRTANSPSPNARTVSHSARWCSGGMAVAVIQVAEQAVQRQVCLVDADRLVEPDPARHGQAQPQPREDDRGEGDEGSLEARVRLAASREPASPAEQLGLVRTAKASEERLQSVAFHRLDRGHRISAFRRGLGARAL